jgi:CRISPR/Cas system-associated protein Cas10 (large subunit of type III CRISPR-Cas system)
MDKFKVKETNEGKYQILGVNGYTLILNNKFDCEKHCNYLNRRENLVCKFREQNIDYYNTLSQIKMITEQIHRESSELHIVELSIRIKELVRKVL